MTFLLSSCAIAIACVSDLGERLERAPLEGTDNSGPNVLSTEPDAADEIENGEPAKASDPPGEDAGVDTTPGAQTPPQTGVMPEGGTAGSPAIEPNCGNGLLEGAEECDDAGESADCNLDCSRSRCGDGVTNVAAGEQCDDGAMSAECNSDCTISRCGDGALNAAAGEQCEPANAGNCDVNCQTVGTALLITGGAAPFDDPIRSRLQMLGLVVADASQDTVTLADTANRDLVVITASADGSVLGARVAEATSPLMILEPALFSANGFGDRVAAANETAVTMLSQHPLAGGLSGTVTIWSNSLSADGVGEFDSMIRVASASGTASAHFVFGFEAGAQMPGGVAPARRVGFTPGKDPRRVAPDSATWMLFDAAVSWLLDAL